MKKARNFEQAFHKFAKNLAILPAEKSNLLAARKDIRACIRQHFANQSGDVISRLDAAECGAWKWVFPRGASPKFLTQGSFAYHTLNRPHTTPHQQADLDDGIYFSTPALDNSNDLPTLLVKILFREVELALNPLVRKKGWKLIANKPTCIRIIISADAHIDLPLYAISAKDVKKLQEMQGFHDVGLATKYENAEVRYHPAVSVAWLAHKTKGWVPSDPQKILQWVVECVARHGQVYRRVCRYLKAWRDCQWEKSPLSSICIMAIVANAIEEAGIRVNTGHDDDILLKVAERMEQYMQKGVCNPVDTSKRLDQEISSADRDDICKRIDILHRSLNDALYDANIIKSDAIKLLRNQFGKYFPTNSNLVFPLTASGIGVTASTKTVSAPRPWAVEDVVVLTSENAFVEKSKISQHSTEWLDRYYPELRVQNENTIVGVLKFKAQKLSGARVATYHGAHPPNTGEKNYIADKYDIEMWFDKHSDGTFSPRVKETGGRLRRLAKKMKKSMLDCHVYPATGELCLAAPQEIARVMQEDSSVENFFEHLLIPILYYHSYCDLFGREPWPGLSHGIAGILEHIADSRVDIRDGRFCWDICCANLEHYRPGILRYLHSLDRDLKAHHQCVCRSGKKIKRCRCLNSTKAIEGANVLRKYLASQQLWDAKLNLPILIPRVIKCLQSTNAVQFDSNESLDQNQFQSKLIDVHGHLPSKRSELPK